MERIQKGERCEGTIGQGMDQAGTCFKPDSAQLCRFCRCVRFIEETLPAIMDALDPHSIYLPPEELRSADEELRGNIEGIGIVFNVPNDTATVINVVVGGPSEKWGCRRG